MMKRILKRPMFKMGGDVENVGIMDGMRKRYSTGTNPQDIDATYTAAGANFKPTNQSAMPALALEALDDKDLDKIEELVPYYMEVYGVDEQEAKRMIIDEDRYSKSGFKRPEVQQDEKIEKRASVLLDDSNFDLGYDGAIQISTAVQNVVDGRNKDVSKEDIDLTQIYIDPEALGSEDQESGIISLTEQKGIYTPGDYQEGLKYYHPIKGKFYTFQGEKFIPVESAQ